MSMSPGVIRVYTIDSEKPRGDEPIKYVCMYVCMLLFLRMIDLTEHFLVKQKSVLKHQKLLLEDVTLRAWVLKNPLIGMDQ